MTAAPALSSIEPVAVRSIALMFGARVAAVAGVRYGHRDAYDAALRDLSGQR